MRVLAEVIASDAAWLVAVNRAIDGVVESNQTARNNPKALHTLDGYKRGLVTVSQVIFSGLVLRRSQSLNRFRTSLRK